MNFKNIATIGLLAAALAFVATSPANAQTNTFAQPTLSVALASTDRVVCVSSATGITVPSINANGSSFLIEGEQMQVQAVDSTGLCFTVARSNRPQPHFSGVTVYAGPNNWFQSIDPPTGACTLSGVYAYPWINLSNGKVYTCEGVWVPNDNSVKRLYGSCSGVATSSQTLGLYNLGQRAALTCTSTVTTLGQILDRPGTVQFFGVAVGAAGTASNSGVFTVVKNGSTTTMTCTVGTGTSCSDSTHTVSFVPGDVLSVQFTTQGSETLADVKARLVIR